MADIKAVLARFLHDSAARGLVNVAYLADRPLAGYDYPHFARVVAVVDAFIRQSDVC